MMQATSRMEYIVFRFIGMNNALMLNAKVLLFSVEYTGPQYHPRSPMSWSLLVLVKLVNPFQSFQDRELNIRQSYNVYLQSERLGTQ